MKFFRAFSVRLEYIAFVIRAVPCRCECPVSPRTRFCVGCPHLDFVRVENSTACAVSASIPVVSGGGLVNGTGVNCPLVQLPTVPTTTSDPSSRGPSSPTLRLSLVRQFWGQCPLPSVTRQAISRQVPIAIRHSSGNFGASAHCRSSFVRQFRGRCPLLSVAHQAIPRQVPIAGRRYLHAIDCLQCCHCWSLHSW